MSNLTTSDVTRKMKSYYDEGISDKQWRSRAKSGYDFYKGKQWDSQDLELLKLEKRPALTINQILPIVNLISGYQRQNRQQIKVYPRKGGTAAVAEILTELAKHTADISNAEFEESMMFFDGYCTGKGWLELELSYEDDPFNGEILISRRSPLQIVEDPNAKEYDLNKTAKYIIKPFWWDKEAVKMSYPEKVKEIELGLGMMDADTKDHDVSTVETDSYQEGERMPGTDPKAHRYRVKETWWKTYEKKRFLINITNLTLKPIHDDNKDVIKKLMAKATAAFNPKHYRIQDIVMPVLHQTVSIGSLILENNEDPFNGITKYPLYRFCPYWTDGYVFGGIDNLKDPQKEINKRASQMLHHLNQSANSGWLGEENWEVESKEDVKSFGSKPGVSIHYKQGKKPDRTFPMKISEGHLILKTDAEGNLKKISNVNADMLGDRGRKTESGIAIRERKEGGLTGNEIVFDNFNYTMQLFNTTLIDLIRRTDVYSDREIEEIVSEANLKNKFDIQTLRTFKLGKYGIKISRNPNLPTARIANFESLLAAAKAGIPIDPEFLIELSDLPNKEKILADLKQKKQMAQQQEQAGVAPGGAAKPAPRGGTQ